MTNEQLCILSQKGNGIAQMALIENILPSLRITAAVLKEKNRGIMLEKEDLVQEALIGTMRAIMTFEPDANVQFLTYASVVSKNAMLDYIEKCKALFPSSIKMESLDNTPSGTDPKDNKTYAEIIPDDFTMNPEQLYIRKETTTEVRNALQNVSDRERTYLHFRFGFVDGILHDQKETAAHFHLSLSRAKSTEKTALDNVRLELPWWY